MTTPLITTTNTNNTLLSVVDPKDNVLSTVNHLLDRWVGTTARGRFSPTDIQPLVSSVATDIEPLIDNIHTQEWLEANCANFLMMIIAAKDNPKSNSNFLLSPQQCKKIFDQIAEYSGNQMKTLKKKKCARCVLAAALYCTQHNEEESMRSIRSMLKSQSLTKTALFVIDEDSDEFMRRRKNLLQPEEAISPAIEVNHHVMSAASDESPVMASASREISSEEFATQQQHLVSLVTSVKNDLERVHISCPRDKEIVDDSVVFLEGVTNLILPIRVAVVGELSSGKSTFLSSVTGCRGFPRDSDGSTTAVVMELMYAPIEGYKATIRFLTREEHRSDIDYYNQHKDSENRKGSNKEDQEDIKDAKWIDIRKKLMTMYEYTYDGDDEGPVIIDFDRPRKHVTDNLDKEPLVLGANSLEALAEIINTHPIFKVLNRNDDTWEEHSDEEGDGEDNPTVKVVCVEGRFEHIPPGVVLLDTPGLGDKKLCRSYRTMSLLDSVNVIWMTSPVMYRMSREWDHKVLTEGIRLENSLDDFCIVATMANADVNKKRSQDALKQYKKQILRAYCNYYNDLSQEYKIDANDDEELVERLKKKKPDVFKELKDKVSKIDIWFMSNMESDYFLEDIQKWRSLLKTYSQRKYLELKEQMKAVQEMGLKYERNGVGASNGVLFRAEGNEFDQASRKLKNELDAILGNKSKKLEEMIATIVKKWDQYDAGTRTKKAIMHPNRSGEFIGQKRKKPMHYDLNKFMAMQWKSMIGESWKNYLSDIKSIEVKLCRSSDYSSVINLYEDIKELGKKWFEDDVKRFLSESLRHAGVYSMQRASFPTEGELQMLFCTILREEIHMIIGNPRLLRSNPLDTRLDSSFTRRYEAAVRNLSPKTVAAAPTIVNIMKRLTDTSAVSDATTTTIKGHSSSSLGRPREGEPIVQKVKRPRIEKVSSNRGKSDA